MKKYLILLIFLIFYQNGTSQPKETYSKNFGNFVIKVTDEVTQNYADIMYPFGRGRLDKKDYF